MREISFQDAVTLAELPIYTSLVYGPTRTGKTTWAATWPRPLIIGDAIEGGYESVRSMASEQLFEPDMPPIIWAIDSASDMAAMAAKVKPLIDSGRVRTIVHDAFSFYCDFYLSFVTQQQTKEDNRAAYGALGKHLRYVRNLWHLMGVNVVWCCVQKDPTDESPKGGPAIPGQEGNKFPAAVSLLFHAESVQIKEGNKVVGTEFQLRTRSHGPWLAGNRLGAKADNLPDPFVGNYADLMEAIGHDVAAIRAMLKANKPIVARQPAAASASVATAAATINRPAAVVAKPNGTTVSKPVGSIPPSSGGIRRVVTVNSK